MASPPQPKKLKMSSTETEPEPESAISPSAGPKIRYKRRKIAIFLAYCGFGYQGMQKNPGARTIEADLEEALFLSGAVPEPDRSKPKRYDWARSARTDKGVSACGQVVSGRFYVDPPGFIDRLNSNLSDQIRVFGFKRTTASFNAKKFCDQRRYVYLLPVFALDPNSHPDRESVMASVDSGNELAKCVECSERGRKVVGVMGKQSRLYKEEVNTNGLVDLAENKVGNGETRDSMADSVKIEVGNVEMDKIEQACVVRPAEEEAKIEIVDGEARHCDTRISGEGEKNTLGNNDSVDLGETEFGKKSGVDDSTNGSEFWYGEKEKERFNRILGRYVGTHNFHNFTTRIKAEDPSAQRYVISFVADRTVSIGGIEFVRCEVVGQSFMLHQIRKMIGFAVAMMRNCCPESLMDTALKKYESKQHFLVLHNDWNCPSDCSREVNINVPTAPEVGLYLDECFFTSYNNKWKETHEDLSMEAYAEQAEEFKLKYIYSHIASMEHKEGAVALWLHSLNHRNYSDLCFQETNAKCAEAEHAQIETLAD